jgi:hypothetical protein
MRALSLSALFTILFAVFTGTAAAKLPPPTAEEQAKAAATKEKAAEDATKEKALLEKAQDRIAQKFGSKGGKSSGTSTDERTEVPAAALNTRPSEKAGAYNESVTPKTAGGASQGDTDRGRAAGVSQEKSAK